jgi:hypothetical protein
LNPSTAAPLHHSPPLHSTAPPAFFPIEPSLSHDLSLPQSLCSPFPSLSFTLICYAL